MVRILWFVASLALTVTPSSLAQTQTPLAATAERALSSAGAKPPPYASALDGFRPWREPALVSWREANDEVARIGGHAGYLRAQSMPLGERRRPVEEKR